MTSKPKKCGHCGDELTHDDFNSTVHSMIHELIDILNKKEPAVGFSGMLELLTMKAFDCGMAKEKFFEIVDASWELREFELKEGNISQ